MLGNKRPTDGPAPSAPVSKPVDTIDTLIGQKTMVKGDIEFSGGLRVDGKVKGNIIARDETNSTLVLSELSEVEGNISVPHVIVNGTVRGSIMSSGHIELQPKSRIIGDVHYKAVEMQLGATINGSLVCDTTKTDAPLKSVADSAAESVEKIPGKSAG
jgi:cytoskeletal protein CcmA (bactofilin family)